MSAPGSGAFDAAAFGEAVRRALAAPAGVALPVALHAPTVTAVVASPHHLPWVEAALGVVLRALPRAGIAGGRTGVIFASEGGEPPRAVEAAAARVRQAFGVPALVHRPGAPCFGVGTTSGGVPVELDDELREAEAIVTVGAVGGTSPCGWDGGPSLLFPGLCSARTREEIRARYESLEWYRRQEADARALAPVDYGVAWSILGKPYLVFAGEGDVAPRAALRAHAARRDGPPS